MPLPLPPTPEQSPQVGLSVPERRHRPEVGVVAWAKTPVVLVPYSTPFLATNPGRVIPCPDLPTVTVPESAVPIPMVPAPDVEVPTSIVTLPAVPVVLAVFRVKLLPAAEATVNAPESRILFVVNVSEPMTVPETKFPTLVREEVTTVELSVVPERVPAGATTALPEAAVTRPLPLTVKVGMEVEEPKLPTFPLTVARVVPKEPVPKPVTSPVRVMVWSPVLVPETDTAPAPMLSTEVLATLPVRVTVPVLTVSAVVRVALVTVPALPVVL